VVVVAFQIVFHVEIYANDFFYFLKIIFDISTLKRFKKYKSHLILTKKKKLKFSLKQVEPRSQTLNFLSLWPTGAGAVFARRYFTFRLKKQAHRVPSTLH